MKHEQQNGRSEKKANFFGGSNFNSPNNYGGKMRIILRIFLLSIQLISCVAIGANVKETASKTSHVITVFQENFEDNVKIAKRFRSSNYSIETGRDGNGIYCWNKDKKNTYIVVSLSAAKLSGCTIELSASIKAENISEKPRSWNGIKLQFHYETKTGAKAWPAIKFPAGSFPWKTFSVKTTLPVDLKKLYFTIGLEACKGKVWYDDISVKVLKSPKNWSFSNPETDDIEAQKLLSLPLAKSHEEKLWPEEPLRGIGMPAYKYHFPTDRLFKKLKSWNVNVVRLAMRVDPGSPWDLKKGPYPPLPANNPMAPYKKNIEGLRIALALAQKYHIYIIPTIHQAVGRGFDDLIAKENVKAGSSAQAVLQEKYWCEFVSGLESFWIYIAENFGDHPWLLGYDLLNEPHTPKEVALQNELFTRIAHRIRSVDKNTWVVIEPGPWSLPDQAFPSTLTPIKDPKVIYSMHFYYPHTYTHQGIHTYTTPEYVNKPYPGILKIFPGKQHLPKYWDKAALENSMKNVIAFQKKYNVKIYVGEFSVIRWAPGAAQWVADVVDIFEKYHWSWAYHGIGYWWNGWNPTFNAKDPQNTEPDGGKTTDRLKVLLKAWSQNKTK